MNMNKWIGYEFESSSVATEEFINFFKDLKKYINNNLPEDMTLVNFKRGHFHCSGFVKKDDKYVYISFSDVRFNQDKWLNDILIRTAEHDKDWTGGCNGYTTLSKLNTELERMLNR